MKVTQIFGLVLLLHSLAISAVWIMPGCQTQKAPPPAPENTYANETGLSETKPMMSEPVKPVAVRTETGLSEPMRPVGRQETRRLDSAFNSGLEKVESGAILEPESLPGEYEAAGPRGEDVGESSYTVQAGDTLSGIARKEQTTVASIKALNGLSGNTIYGGQVLKVKRETAPVTVVAEDSVGSETYVVVSGDSLSRIAKRYQVTAGELKQANNLKNDTIYVGQKLYIPGRNSVGAPSQASVLAAPKVNTSGSTYTVQSGDSPIRIANKLGVNSKDLMAVNGISDPRRLVVGQVLIVPGGGSGTNVVPSTSSSVKKPVTTGTSKSASAGALVVEPTQPKELKPEPTVSDLESMLESDDIPLMELEEVDSTGSQK